MEWLSIPQLAAALGISDNTVRRYTKRFPDFFMSKTVDGVRKYPLETVEVLRRIYDLYQNEGRSKTEIKKIIRAEFPQPIEINKQDDDDILTPAAAAPQLVTVLDKLDKLTAAFERVATVLERQADQDRRIADLESRLNALALIGSGGAPVAPEASAPTPPVDTEQELEAYKKRMRARIVKLRDDGMSWQEIADMFNTEGLPTFSRKGLWYQGVIASMYQRSVKEKR